MPKTCRVSLVLTVVFLLESSLGWSAEAIPDLINAYTKLQVGDAVAVSKIDFRWAHLSIEFESGTAAPIYAGATRVGVFLQGSGTVSYRTLDPIEQPIVLTNLKHATKIRAEKDQEGLTIRDTFTEAVLIGAGPVALPNLEGNPAPPLQATFEKHQSFFARDISTPLAHLLLIQRVDAPDRPVVHAEFRGGKESLVYEFDEVFSRSEWLYSLTQLSEHAIGELSQYLFPAVLSEQPIKRDRRDPIPPRILLTDINYVLTASEGKEASFSMVQTLQPVVPQQIVRMDLYEVVHEDQEKAPRRFNVRKILDENGQQLPFHHQRDQLIIGLPSRAAPNKPFRLSFEIDGNFLIRPRNSSFWQLSGDWFPQPEFAGLGFTVRSTVKVKQPFIPFVAGKAMKRRTEGDYNVVENHLDVPVRWPDVHAGKYTVKEETRNGITVRVATYVMRNDRAVRELTDLTFAAIAFYQPFLGPFPFSEFNIIQVDSYGYGQAPPGTMFITHEAFTSVIDEMSRIFSEGVNERFLHEIAHQYWGNVVSFPNLEEQWLSESFAQYCAALALRKGKGESTYKRLLNTWRTNGNQASPVAPIPLVNRIAMPNASDYEQWAMRHWLLYQKGPYLLAVLHKELGDEVFLTFLKSYQKSFAWKLGSTKHVIGLLKVLTKKDYTPFFESYFWGTEMPEMPK